jgi:two-component system, NtrC family, response regulator HydG
MAEAKKILVVDDEEEIRELFNLYLPPKGYSVKTAKDGLEAIKLADSEKFNFIFLDIKMSGLNGIETFKHIKDTTPNSCIIIMTGYRTLAKELLTDALKKQIHSILYKPFSMKEVLGLITAKGG